MSNYKYLDRNLTGLESLDKSLRINSSSQEFSTVNFGTSTIPSELSLHQFSLSPALASAGSSAMAKSGVPFCLAGQHGCSRLALYLSKDAEGTSVRHTESRLMSSIGLNFLFQGFHLFLLKESKATWVYWFATIFSLSSSGCMESTGSLWKGIDGSFMANLKSPALGAGHQAFVAVDTPMAESSRNYQCEALLVL